MDKPNSKGGLKMLATLLAIIVGLARMGGAFETDPYDSDSYDYNDYATLSSYLTSQEELDRSLRSFATSTPYSRSSRPATSTSVPRYSTLRPTSAPNSSAPRLSTLRPTSTPPQLATQTATPDAEKVQNDLNALHESMLTNAARVDD